MVHRIARTMSANHEFLPVKHEFFLRKRSDEKLTSKSDHGKLLTRTKTTWEKIIPKSSAKKDAARWVPVQLELERFGNRYLNVESLCAWDFEVESKSINPASIVGAKDRSLLDVYEQLRSQLDARTADLVRSKGKAVKQK